VTRRHLLIFAKAPRLAAVKRRLAAGIGDVEAWRFYGNTMRATIGRIAWDERWRTSLYVTPDRFAVSGAVWPSGIARIGQGSGDLGARMSRALREQPPGPVVLVGTDIPSLTAIHIDLAFRKLGEVDVVLGPALDGGFWLIGLARRRSRSIAFWNVRWSTEWALGDTSAGLAKAYSVALIETLEDIDDESGYERLRRTARGVAPGTSAG
jgi:hypothetical protein